MIRRTPARPRRCRSAALPRALIHLLPLAVALLPLPPTVVLAVAPPPVVGGGVTGWPVVLRDDLVLESTGLDNVVRDFADWRAPAWIGWNSPADPFPWTDAVADGNLVVGFCGETGPWPVGFVVHDYRDPAAPVRAALRTGLPVRSAWLRQGVLLVDAGTAVVAYDLAEPTAPAFTALVPVADGDVRRRFSQVGSTLFLAETGATGIALRALDIADPRHPADLGTIALAGQRCDALVAGPATLHGLVATDGRLELVTWAVETPTSLRETARTRLVDGPGAEGHALARAGDLLLAAAGDGFTRAFDLADPRRPAPGWRLSHDADRLAICDHAVLIHALDGLYVYERGPATRAPGPPCRRETLPPLAAIAGEAPWAFARLPGEPAALAPLDLTDPAWPRLGKPVATELGGPLQCAGNLGVLRANIAELRLLDLSEPGAPRVCGRVTLPWPDSRALLLSRELLAIDHNFSFDRAIDLIDVSDPDRPVRGASLHERHALATGGDWLVCGDGGSRHRDDPRVYKLDGTAQPALLGSLPTLLESVHLARAADDCLYLFGQDDHGDWWFEVHQVRDLPRPARLSGQPLGPPAVAAIVHGGRLLVQGDSDCRVWDVSDARRPVPIGTLPAPGRAGAGFALAGDVTVASGRLLTIGTSRAPEAVAAAPRDALSASAAAAARLQPACPNPANGGVRLSFASDGENALTLSVYDVRGRHVRDLAGGTFAAGAHTVDWDGRATGGKVLAAGTYFVRLHGHGVEAVQSVTLVK